MTGFDLVTHIIPWCLTVCALSFSLYNIVHSNKEKEKERTRDYAKEITTVNVKLDNIQSSTNNIQGTLASFRETLNDHEKRITVVETRLEKN